MIRIVEGVPGSGKSYFGVHYVCSRFAKYDQVYDDFTVNNDVVLITNIEGFRPKHKQLDDLIEKYGGIEKFFTVENFEKLIAYYKCKNIVLLIDEAQRYFDSKYYDKDVFYFFQYHRHLGVDIFLFTQKVSTVARHLLPLAEFIITAAPRSLAFGNTFRYKFKDLEGNSLYSRVLAKNQTYFKAYKSYVADEAEKPKNVITRLAIMVIVMTLIVILGGKAVLAMMKAHYSKPIRPPQSSQPVPALPPGSPAPASSPAPVPPAVPVQPIKRESRYFPPEPIPSPVREPAAFPAAYKEPEKPKRKKHELEGYGMYVKDGVQRWWVRYTDSSRMVELAKGCNVDEEKNVVNCSDAGGRGRDPGPPES